MSGVMRKGGSWQGVDVWNSGIHHVLRGLMGKRKEGGRATSVTMVQRALPVPGSVPGGQECLVVSIDSLCLCWAGPGDCADFMQLPL